MDGSDITHRSLSLSLSFPLFLSLSDFGKPAESNCPAM
jgi:hypothetical protein